METVEPWSAMGDVPPFDYDALDEGTRAAVLGCRDEIERRVRRSVGDLVAIGRTLTEAKERLPHGQFGRWLAAEFGWSWQTANNLMNVARLGDQIPNDLEFGEAVLYALAAPSTPAEVRAEMVARARAGEPVRRADVASAIAARRPDPPPPPTRRVEVRITTTERAGQPTGRDAIDESDTRTERQFTEAVDDLDERAKGTIIDVTGSLRPATPVAEGVAEDAGDPDVSPEDRARIGRFGRVLVACRNGGGPGARFWKELASQVFYYPLDPHDPDADPARIVAAMSDGDELDEAEAIAADLLRWAALLVADIDERRAGR